MAKVSCSLALPTPDDLFVCANSLRLLFCFSAICDAHKKKVGVEQVYNLDEDRKSGSWREDTGMRNMSQRGWTPRPPVEQHRGTGKKNCCGHKSVGQYVAVLFSLQLTSSLLLDEILLLLH